MSYDVLLFTDLGGAELSLVEIDDDLNYTYNVGAMFRDALGGLGLMGLNGRSCAEVSVRLHRAIVRMTDDPARYRAMNPTNGWGDYEGAVKFLSRILRQCERHPRARLAIT